MYRFRLADQSSFFVPIIHPIQGWPSQLAQILNLQVGTKTKGGGFNTSDQLRCGSENTMKSVASHPFPSPSHKTWLLSPAFSCLTEFSRLRQVLPASMNDSPGPINL